ncbi:MAG: AAA family ATPase, partial [Eubacteriales bacterium]|nr:AAA family ATPase [Eubacteriales bacterium]
MNKGELRHEQLRKTCEYSIFPFQSTADVSPLEGIIGQERAVRALEFGLEINKPGYNIFIVGVTGTGRNSYTQSLVNKVAATEESSKDWCYIYNFDNPDQPKAISFLPGQAVEFQDDVKQLLSRVTLEISRALESEEYQKAKTLLSGQLQSKQSEVQTYINKAAKELGFALKPSEKGLFTTPLNSDGKPMEEEEYQSLDETESKMLGENAKRLNFLIQDAFKKLREYERTIEEELEKLESKIIIDNTGSFFDELIKKYATNSPAVDYLEKIREDLLANAQEFKEREQTTGLEFLLLRENRPKNFMQKYQVNVLTNNGKGKGAPVVTETNPTYYNLM